MVRKTDVPRGETPLEPPGFAFSDESRKLTPLLVFGNEDPTIFEFEPGSNKIDPSHQKIQDFELGTDRVDSDHEKIKVKIAAALKLLKFREQHVLVQFWSPHVAGKHQYLTTTYQPFGFGSIDVGLRAYRKDSEGRSFIVDKDHDQEGDHSPATQVFGRGLPEWTSDLKMFTPKQFPQRESAIRCNLYGYLALPVFDSNTQLCVGVLELLTASKYKSYAYEVHQIHTALKIQNLTIPQGFDSPVLYGDDDSSINPPKRRKPNVSYGEVRDGSKGPEKMMTSPHANRIYDINDGFAGQTVPAMAHSTKLLQHAHQSKINNIMQKFDFEGQSGSLQYWEYKQVGNKGLLTVADQLFVSTQDQKGLKKYRKRSLNKQIFVGPDIEVDPEWFAGLAAQKRVAYQRTRGDPNQILGQLVVPVFSYEGADEKFTGVIELVTIFPKESHDADFNQIQHLLKVENLATKYTAKMIKVEYVVKDTLTSGLA